MIKNHKMLRALLICTVLLVQTYALGEFSILSTPPSLEFKGTQKLESDAVSDVIAASLGHSVLHNTEWSGLYVKDPFNVPEGVVAIVLDGVADFHSSQKSYSFPLTGDNVHESFNILTSNLEEQNSVVVDLDLNQGSEALLTYGDIFGEIQIPAIKKSNSNLKPDLHSEDKLFLQQVAIINELAAKFPTYKQRPSLITIRVSLSPVALAHGKKSPAMTEAIKLISDAVEKLSEAVSQAYNNNVLVVVAAFTEEMGRSKRQTPTEESKEIDPAKINIAKQYSENYPVFFNIMLWFGVIFFFSLLAISYAIASMDPGRDSIIYRMTSNRMKKEN